MVKHLYCTFNHVGRSSLSLSLSFSQRGIKVMIIPIYPTFSMYGFFNSLDDPTPRTKERKKERGIPFIGSFFPSIHPSLHPCIISSIHSPFPYHTKKNSQRILKLRIIIILLVILVRLLFLRLDHETCACTVFDARSGGGRWIELDPLRWGL